MRGIYKCRLLKFKKEKQGCTTKAFDSYDASIHIVYSPVLKLVLKPDEKCRGYGE